MEKASHNTFSYAQPLQWWLRPFAFVGRCQDKRLEQQIAEGVRIFDLRLRKDGDGEWVIAHNAFIYVRGIKAIDYIMQWLDGVARHTELPVYVRVLHEVRNDRQAARSDSVAFNTLCSEMCSQYRNIKFFGGQRVMDWRQDYVFPSENYISYTEMHASVRWPGWLHWCPWIYARLYNESNEQKYADKDMIVFTDFI